MGEELGMNRVWEGEAARACGASEVMLGTFNSILTAIGNNDTLN